MTKDKLRSACDRHLSGHRRRTPAEWLSHLSRAPSAAEPLDFNGDGGPVTSLERRVAKLVGKPAGLFVTKGTIAQMAAMRTWTDQVGSRRVALHPRSHIDGDEDGAYQHLHGLVPVRLGSYAPFGIAELAAVRERLGLVVVELPLRRASFRLPPWDELVSISDWCRQHQVPFHIDGARLWESTPFYQRSFAEIAALADSIYVSFYKGLGGLAGSVICAPDDVIAQIATWRNRHGGALYHAFPYAVAAHDGLDRQLPRIRDYCARARRLAATLGALPELTAVPTPPHTNSFSLHVSADPGRLERSGLDIAAERGVWLFDSVYQTAIPGTAMVEIIVGDALDDFTDDEVVGLLLDAVAAAAD